MKKIIITILLSIFVIAGILTFLFVNRINHVKIDKSDEALGISNYQTQNLNTQEIKNEVVKEGHLEEVKVEEEPDVEYEKINNVVNIALFGIDSRDTSKKGRSDSIIIASIDFQNNKIKLSSLMRDMYVSVENHGNTKINHSYAYGGAQLAIKTINQNFGTDIRDYVTVDFFTLEKIIDIMGGVEIDVKEKEIDMLNGLMNEVANIQKEKPIYVKEAGKQILNGKQAVAYSRIRYVGNGDFERTERQKRVLTAMIEKAKEEVKDVKVLPKLIYEILPLVETSMDFQTIFNLGVNYLKSNGLDIEQERFPVDGYYWNDMSTGTFYLKYEVDATKQQITDYIFKDIKPVPKK